MIYTRAIFNRRQYLIKWERHCYIQNEYHETVIRARDKATAEWKFLQGHNVLIEKIDVINVEEQNPVSDEDGSMGMGLFKNFKTKRQLREENIQLKARLDSALYRPMDICTIERNIHRVQAKQLIRDTQRDVPEEYIKESIARNMAEELRPFINYDFYDAPGGGKIYSGTLYVATGSQK